MVETAALESSGVSMIIEHPEGTGTERVMTGRCCAGKTDGRFI